MRNFRSLFAVSLLLILPAQVQAEMRCNGQLIQLGDYKADVLIECGEPFLKDQVYADNDAAGMSKTVAT